MKRNNVVIVYKSKYGATKTYANMMCEMLDCDVFEADSFSFHNIDKYDVIIAAGGIYASGISIMKYIRKNRNVLKDKNVIILAVGASPYNKETFEAVKEHNLKNVSLNVEMFYARGTYDEECMSFKDRTLCQMLKKSLRKKDPANFEPWMKALFEADGKRSDWTDKKYIEPVLTYIKAKSNNDFRS